MDKIRIQVYLSRNGVCSRRKAMDLVQSGDVKVNHKIIREPSFLVDPDKDRVTVNGRGIRSRDFLYVLMNKQAGFMTTKSDKHAQKTVFDLMPRKWRHLIPVGRLDKDTEGLLLLTNDGDLAYTLTHPKFNIDKTYFVMVKGLLDPKARQRMEKGIYLDGRRTAPSKISRLHRGKKQTTFQMTIHEGRKRQIRLVCQKLGYPVMYLKRIQQGPLTLGSLKTGEVRLLKKTEIEKLKAL